MDQVILVAAVAVVAIAAATALSARIRVAAPLILVVVGIAVSLLPFVPDIEVDPEVILVGILPPLLYAAATLLPTVEFRRDLLPISGLAFVLVLVSTVGLGLFFAWAIPGIGLFLGLALGAILSPTDAVATAIAKRLGVSGRVITMLEGESLLNDATALVTLRTAIAAIAAGTFSIGEFFGKFAWAVFLAIVVGAVVGWVSVRVRSWISDSAASTALGFVVPFAAFLPTEHFGGSGLVAAVVSGIVVGQSSPRRLSAEQRLADSSNWRTVERVLEGAVFLIMGLELESIWAANIERHNGPYRALGLALAALGIILVVRAAYVAIMIPWQARRARPSRRSRLEALDKRIEDVERKRGAPLDRVRAGVSRAMNDLAYYESKPLTWRHGGVIVWAGMRGVVTLAAAQTLPRDTVARELLILVAFLVALVSLMVQGLSLPLVVRAIKIPTEDERGARTERDRLQRELADETVRAFSPVRSTPRGARRSARHRRRSDPPRHTTDR